MIIAKKVIKNIESDWHIDTYYCGNCEIELYDERFNKNGHCCGSGSILKSNKVPKYCPECGTAVYLTEESWEKSEWLSVLGGAGTYEND